MKLISQGDQTYISEDGRIEVILDHTFETECDDPHPVRLRVDALDRIYSPKGIEDMKRRGKITSKYLKSENKWVEYLTYYCEGNDTHFYSQWTVKIDGEWTDDVYDTFEEALSEVEKEIGEKITISRPRKPKKTEREVTEDGRGIRYWAACGHRAELDINEDCYTCHQSVSS